MSELVPEGAIMTQQITIFAYLNDEGEEEFSVSVDGDPSLSSSIGILEMVKHAWLSGVNS